LDEHLLVIEMEDGNSESGKLQYVVDRDNMNRLSTTLRTHKTAASGVTSTL
jgi:hypothetical protein